MRNAHVRLVVRVYFTLCHSHLTALLFRSLLSFFSRALALSPSLCVVSFISMKLVFYSFDIYLYRYRFDSQLRSIRFDSIVFCLDQSSVADFSWCCSIVIQSLGFSLAPDFIQIERSKRIKTLHSIAFLSAFTTVFFSLSRWLLFDLKFKWLPMMVIFSFFSLSLSLFHPMAIKHLNISLH